MLSLLRGMLTSLNSVIRRLSLPVLSSDDVAWSSSRTSYFHMADTLNIECCYRMATHRSMHGHAMALGSRARALNGITD